MRRTNKICISDIVQLLLAHNAPVKVKNFNGWTPLAEAVSYGDRITSKSMLYNNKYSTVIGNFVKIKLH